MKYLTHIHTSGVAYIDTGFKPNQNTRVVMDVELTSMSSGALRALFGVRDTNSNTAPNQFVCWAASSGTSLRTDYFGTSVSKTVQLLGERFIVDYNRNLCTVNSTTTVNGSATGQCTNNLYLGNMNNVGVAGYGTSLNIYSCKIYDNDTLIRDYIPVKNDSNVVGMLDKISSVFYPSANGVFSAGEEFISHTFTGLTSGKYYHARVFTVNPDGVVNNNPSIPHVSVQV